MTRNEMLKEIEQLLNKARRDLKEAERNLEELKSAFTPLINVEQKSKKVVLH